MASTDFAAVMPVSLPTRSLSALLLVYTMLVSENPLIWTRRQGKRNPQADLSGPFYITGAPNRMIADGKAALASYEEIKEHAPFLLMLRVRGPDGAPVANAKIDWWQADTHGVYHHTAYAMRGTFTTDATGRVDVLTVPPGKYGFKSYMRAGHFHFHITPADSACDALTTQAYLCRANEPSEMGTDFLNWIRGQRDENMIQAWSIPSANDGKPYMDLPPLSSDATDVAECVAWWNAKLAEKGDLQVVAGGECDVTLNAKSGWF